MATHEVIHGRTTNFIQAETLYRACMQVARKEILSTGLIREPFLVISHYANSIDTKEENISLEFIINLLSLSREDE
jgi:hypothetical protein